MGKNLVVQVGLVTANISPAGFHRYAAHYLMAAESFNPDDTGFSPVPYFLYCRAIELFLKAFLLLRGIPKDALKKRTLGHDLNKALARANKEGLGGIVQLPTGHEGEIRKANKYYHKKGFEYFKVTDAVTGYKDLPHLDTLAECARQLCSELAKPCLEAD